MKPHEVIAIACLGITASCGGVSTAPGTDCVTGAFPLSGSANGPVVVAVSLEVQSGGIVVLATATDPQGTQNLLGVQQSISVFANVQCTGTPLLVQDDLAGSGIEESFGTVVALSDNPTLFAAIKAATSWPVVLDFSDRDGNRTAGRVMATVND